MKEINEQTNNKQLKVGGIVAEGNLIPILGLLSFHEHKTYTLEKNHK